MRKRWRAASRSLCPESQRRVWTRDRGVCIYCGTDSNLIIDHVVPYLNGGPSSPDNAVLCCYHCNKLKSGRDILAYLDVGMAYLARIGADLSWLDRMS